LPIFNDRRDEYRDKFAGRNQGVIDAMGRANSRPDPEREKNAREQSELLRMLAGLAPLAGGAIGTGIGAIAGLAGGPGAPITVPAAAAIGGGIGSAVGGMAGGGLNYGADRNMDPYQEQNMEKARQLEALQAYMAMRR